MDDGRATLSRLIISMADETKSLTGAQVVCMIRIGLLTSVRTYADMDGRIDAT